MIQNVLALGGRPGKIAVMGESAGGNLAVNVGIMARDRNVPQPVEIVAIYPIAGADMDTESYLENENAKPLNKLMMSWFFQNYLNAPTEITDHRIDLVHANLSGIAPTIIVTAQIDPLRSEGEQLVAQLKSAGVPVVYQNFDGVTHEFFGMAAVLDQANLAQNFVATELIRTLKFKVAPTY